MGQPELIEIEHRCRCGGKMVIRGKDIRPKLEGRFWERSIGMWVRSIRFARAECNRCKQNGVKRIVVPYEDAAGNK